MKASSGSPAGRGFSFWCRGRFQIELTLLQFRAHIRVLAARPARVLRQRPALFIRRAQCYPRRGQGMPDARRVRSRVRSVESTRVSHHGHTGVTRHSPRSGFAAYSALSLVTGLSCHHRRRNLFRQLDASVGASGPHGFAVREKRRSLSAPSASTASRPAFVTIASRPSDGTRRRGICS
jgi:hypothetical protein